MWFASTERLAYYAGLRMVAHVVTPFVRLGVALAFKV